MDPTFICSEGAPLPSAVDGLLEFQGNFEPQEEDYHHRLPKDVAVPSKKKSPASFVATEPIQKQKATQTSLKGFSFAEWFLRCLIAAELPIFIDDSHQPFQVQNQLLKKYKNFKNGKSFVFAWLGVQPKTDHRSHVSTKMAEKFVANGSGHDAEMSKILYESRRDEKNQLINLSPEERLGLVLRAAGLNDAQQLKQVQLHRDKEDFFANVTHIAPLRYLETDPSRNSDKSAEFRTFLETLDDNSKVFFVGDVNNHKKLIEMVPAEKRVKLHFSELSEYLENIDEELIPACDFQLQVRFYVALKHKLPNVTVIGTQTGLLDVIGIAMGVPTIRFAPSTFDKTRTAHIQGAYGLSVDWRDFV